MAKKKLENIIKRRFENAKFNKIILFKNPNEFKSMYIERINPNHVGILWGRRKKKLNKGTNPIRFGKVFFEIIPLVYGLSVLGWLDCFTNYAYGLLVSVGFFGLFVCSLVCFFFYYLPFRFGSDIECLNGF